MEKPKRKPLPVFLIAAVLGLVLLAALTGSPEDRISNFVADNQSALEAIALDQLAGDNSMDTYKCVQVEGVYGGIVQFSYASSGLVPASKYRGLYYSRDDVPAAFQDARVPLEQTADGWWEWSDGTDNGGVTKRLTDHWFYYEAWF